MNRWNQLQALLDSMFGFPNKVSSKVKKLQQGFDNRTQEHVVWIEYRVQVNNVQPPTRETRLFKESSGRTMSLMRALLDQSERPR